ncbi:FAD-binding oxidoreductase [Streptomyces sp. NPDC058001]|uniref:FAD-binding oxidoreductase n=1 Tax=Streptomyces sp. NPDC058001 TaxID=3346300 RepID=UPI0036E739DE
MGGHSRRNVLRATALTGAGAALTVTGSAGTPASASAASSSGVDRDCPPPPELVRAGPDDPRYAHLTSRGASNRFRGTPDTVYVPSTTRQVVRAVQDAVRSGGRVAVRSGGHCFEDFVDHPDVRTVIDLSGMADVYFDPVRHAFVVEAGATLGEAFRRLYLGWGVTVPGGYCPEVGTGGHVPGGGYGPLCRLFGLISDHLYAVEVVVVDRAGRARSVIASREPSDPHRDLWWAHTGGGGGSFGVVTRYWFRSPGTTAATAPERLLPAPPASALTFRAEWTWEGLDRSAFSRLVANHGRWAGRNSAPGSEQAALYSEFVLLRRAAGFLLMVGQVAAGPGAGERLLDEHIGAISAGGPRPARLTKQRMPWLTAALRGTGDEVGDWRLKIKSGYLRRPFTDRQIATIHHHLTRTDSDVVSGSLSLNTYGGQVNTVAPAATAVAQRDAVVKLSYLTAWERPDQDAAHLAWIRAFYRDMYADTGGVPVPGSVHDGAFLNYPDSDLADPAWNTSGEPWHALYFKGNYARLQAVKRRWDPRDVFHHALSVRLEE